jgi:electron transport complex protein RnfG
MQKNNWILPAVYLFLICLITTGLVALTFSLTREARDLQEEISANANRRLIVPQAVAFTEVQLDPGAAADGLIEAYRAIDEDGETIAWLLVAGTRGYGGQVPVMLAIDSDQKISGIKVLNNDETPGLGKKAADSSFIAQYLDQKVDRGFALADAGTNQVAIDAVAGATISSKAVNTAVTVAVDYYLEHLAEVPSHGS